MKWLRGVGRHAYAWASNHAGCDLAVTWHGGWSVMSEVHHRFLIGYGAALDFAAEALTVLGYTDLCLVRRLGDGVVDELWTGCGDLRPGDLLTGHCLYRQTLVWDVATMTGTITKELRGRGCRAIVVPMAPVGDKP